MAAENGQKYIKYATCFLLKFQNVFSFRGAWLQCCLASNPGYTLIVLSKSSGNERQKCECHEIKISFRRAAPPGKVSPYRRPLMIIGCTDDVFVLPKQR